MNHLFRPHTAFIALCLTILVASAPSAHAAPPDLTAPGVIDTIDRKETYNLGPTGLRGWIYITRYHGSTHGEDGTATDESRQILVTVAASPANAVLAVDDVILGAVAANSGSVPNFTSDARKAFGAAITEAEKPGGGILRVKHWRAGAIAEVNIPITTIGEYSATAPYSCPKSDAIRAAARNRLVSQLLAPDPAVLENSWKGSIHALALLAGVQPGDPNSADVESRLRTYASARASAGPVDAYLPIWYWSYTGLFLAEYYLLTGDANVLPGVQSFTLKLAESQTLNGTFGHGPSVLRPDGSGRMMGTGYGPVNSVGIVANMAIVLGKKAMLAGGLTIHPKIDAAVQRGSDFFAFYVNKGSIPYGEHEPWAGGHASNGKDQMCAVFFGLQEGRAAETEYYARMSIAAHRGREAGHTGQGFSYLWGALGANMGGITAVAEHLKQVRWHLDLVRRTDGSFAYEGPEGYGGGATTDGTYLGATGYYGLNPTASYLLTFSLPLQRLYITGKRDVPASPPPLNLDAATVAHAIDAGNFKLNAPSLPNSTLLNRLSDYDPIVRHYAAVELGKTTRTLSAAELTTLRNLTTGSDANARMGACQALGLRKDSTALPSIIERLDKITETDLWVRAKAATAIGSYTPATASTHRDTMMAHFMANSHDPDVIDWTDPIQMSNSFLSYSLFGGAAYYGNSLRDYLTSADRTALYPSLRTGLEHPDSRPRVGAAKFCFDKLPLADVQALIPDLIKFIQIECLADRMWSQEAIAWGIKTLSKYKIREGIPLAVGLLDVPAGFEWGTKDSIIPALDALASYGDAARWTLPRLRAELPKWSPGSDVHNKLLSTIPAIDNAITAPAQNPGLAVANSQVVSTTGPKAITLTGTSPRSAVTFANVTAPLHGTLSGTAPNLTYTPNAGYTGPDHFTFQVIDSLGTENPSAPGTVAIIVGTPGNGLLGEYYDNPDFTNLKLTRTDPQVNFDWGTGSPHASISPDTFSVRWNGLLLVPETGTYTFSTLSSDGVRLYVKGVPVIDRFAEQNTRWLDGTPIDLIAGEMVEIQMDYFENTGSAMAKLKWTGPSFAGSNGEIIGSQWLYDGTGMPRTPYAFAQSLTMLKNKSQPITLLGSVGTVSYAVVTPPAHGTLTGTAPNLVYTPHTNYIGLDSFTFKVNNGTTDSAPATITINVIPANTFSVNFYANGGLSSPEAQANLKVHPGMSAGLPDWFTYGWENIEVPWAPSSPQPPVTLTSNQGTTASFVLKDCRNGGPYNGSVPRTTLLNQGNGNMMDGHVNSTFDPGDGSNLFDIEVTEIPFTFYDVIFYMGANLAQFGDGTGIIQFNGGAQRAFKLKPGAFDGTFIEMTDATTPGNYIIFRGVSSSSFTAQTWGNGFNHIGPFGFQIREAVPPGDTTTLIAASPTGSSVYGNAVTLTATVSASGVPAPGTVTFKDGTEVLGTGTLDGNGVATFTSSSLAVGSHSFTAAYAGEGPFHASESSSLEYTVAPKPVTIIGVTASGKIYDGTTVASLTGGTVSGVISGETLSVIPGSGAFASANVGTWPVTADGYALGGLHAGNYQLTAQPTVPNASISPRPVQLVGSRTYNGTTLVTAPHLTIANQVVGDDISLSGTVALASKDAGTHGLVLSQATPVRVQSNSGFSASANDTSFPVNLNSTPTFGNTLIAVVSTRGNSADRVTGISSTGATWSRVTQSVNGSGSTTEIWFAPVGTNASPNVTVSVASIRSVAIITEYSGILTPLPLDQSAASSGGNNTTPVTGTTALTTQDNELWIGGIGYRSSTPVLSGILNSFTSIASAQSNVNKASNNVKVNALERIVSATGTASTGGTLSASVNWSGAIATFKTATNSGLTLAGTTTGNYTLTGLTGSIEIIPAALTVTANDQAKAFGETLSFGSGATDFAGSGLIGDETIGSVSLTCAGGDPAANAGNYPITPSAATGGTFNPANYAIEYLPGTLSVSALPTTTTVISSGSPSQYGNPVTFTATVVPAPDGGTVQFYAHATALGDPVPLTAGQAQLVTSVLNSGSHFISATYSGHINHEGSEAAAIGQVVAKATPVITTPPTATAITFGQALADSTLSGGAASVPGTFAFTDPTTVPALGSASHSVTFTPVDTENHLIATTSVSVTVNAAQSPYKTWAANPAHGLTAGINDDPLDDPDHDGFCNIMEFVLGGEPMVSAQAIQPTLSHLGGNWIFSYHRSHLSKSSTIQAVEHSDGMGNWTPLPIPLESSGFITITPGPSSDLVEVIIPATGDKCLVRLKVSQ